MFRRHVNEHVSEVVLEVNSIFAAYEWTFIFVGFIAAILILSFGQVKEYAVLSLGVAAFFALLKIVRRVYSRI